LGGGEGGNDPKPCNLISTPVKWEPPPSCWAKLNTDGSSLGNPGLVGGGGVICDSNGCWVRSFSQVIDFTTSFQAELRALKDGLLLAIDLEIPDLEKEIDSLVAVELVKATNTINIFLNSIVGDCRYFLEKLDNFTLKHI
jgi:ribonuclease HI